MCPCLICEAGRPTWKTAGRYTNRLAASNRPRLIIEIYSMELERCKYADDRPIRRRPSSTGDEPNNARPDNGRRYRHWHGNRSSCRGIECTENRIVVRALFLYGAGRVLVVVVPVYAAGRLRCSDWLSAQRQAGNIGIYAPRLQSANGVQE